MGSPVNVVRRSVPPASAERLQAEQAEQEAQLQRVRVAFAGWDRDGDGRISRQDVQAVLRQAGIDWPEETLAAMVGSLDSDGNGRIEWEEFSRACLHKLRRERYQPPEDVLTEMEQELHRKQQVHRA